MNSIFKSYICQEHQDDIIAYRKKKSDGIIIYEVDDDVWKKLKILISLRSDG